MESMESHLSSSGFFPGLTTLQTLLQKRFKTNWKLIKHTTVEIFKDIQIKMATRGIRPEEFDDRIIFMSMFNDIDSSKGEDNSNIGLSNSLKVRDRAKRFQKISKTADMRSSEPPAHWIGDS